MSAATPLSELTAQVQELKAWAAQRGRALAQQAADATSPPFPDRVLPGQGCSCAFGPRCESATNCVDENAAMGLKDRRTGEIRKLAEWSIMLPWWSRGHHPAPRVHFYCNECLEKLKAVWGLSWGMRDMPFEILTPSPMRDWTDACHRTNEKVKCAAYIVANATTATARDAGMIALREARAEFGAAMLDLDKRRRPSFYGLR